MDVGEELVDSILDLARADELGKVPQGSNIPGLKLRVEEVRRYQPPAKNKAVLDGNEIMETLNIKPGKQIKEVAEFLLSLEDKFIEEGKTLDKDTAKKEIIKEFK